jgi:hypothetical protein
MLGVVAVVVVVVVVAQRYYSLPSLYHIPSLLLLNQNTSLLATSSIQ